MSDVEIIDVRPMLAQGTDPLLSVVGRARQMARGDRLDLDAPFNPQPLRRALAALGVSSTALQKGPRHWRVRLTQDGEGRVEGGDAPDDSCAGLSDSGAPVDRRSDGVHIDVRGLKAPMPMVAILRLISSLDDGATVIVHHDREPVFLVPELAEIGWTMEALDNAAGDLQFRLERRRP